jgi:hypothetical protein
MNTLNVILQSMQQTINNFVADSLTAGTTSFVTAAAMVPPPDMTTVQTIYIPLITGILAPLVKELIISLREARKRRKEREENQKEK